MLTIEEFNQLSNPEKFYILEEQGIYLELYLLTGPHKKALFSLHHFYCEVWLNQSTDRIVKAIAFDSDKKLKAYLQQIDITEIYSKL